MKESSVLDGVAFSSMEGASLPLVMQPQRQGPEMIPWVGKNADIIKRELLKHGAVLFRGFGISNVDAFEELSRAISTDYPHFLQESSPRTTIRGIVQSSTDYPASYPIQFHNEYSYSALWPMKIFFGCLTPSSRGGQTPIADSRKVLQRLSSATRARFEAKGVLYQRNYVPGVGVRWQDAFHTTDPKEVESRCRALEIECEWVTRDRLTTRQVGGAIAHHPDSGEASWFNHGFFFNVRSLEPLELREFMLGEPEGNLATQTYYGDGTPIEEKTLEEIRRAYQDEAVMFDWMRGDVLLIDNMLTSHSRKPYSGKREVLAIMAEGCSNRG